MGTTPEADAIARLTKSIDRHNKESDNDLNRLLVLIDRMAKAAEESRASMAKIAEALENLKPPRYIDLEPRD